MRGLARVTDVPLATIRRVLDELAALGCVETLRPGRDAHVTWREGPIADWLAEWPPLDMEASMLDEFRAAYGDGDVHAWDHPDEDASDPRTPMRFVVMVNEKEEEDALDRVGPALDALALAGWPAPDVTVQVRSALEPSDPVAAAMLRSRRS